MRGVMIVVAEGADLAQAKAAERPGERPLVKAWEMKDLEGPLMARDKARDAVRGQKVMEAANCLQCHAVSGKGGVAGPDLGSIGARYQGVELLRQILEPSAQIEECFKNVAFTLQSGKRVIGQVQ
jgi:mono/diheme cytochrome c family protein